MAVSLQKGQRVGLGNSIQYALVGLGWDSNKYDGGYDFDLDASAFLLGANGRVLRDEDFVFYNNLEARNGAVKSMGDDLTGGNSDGGDDEQIYIDFRISDRYQMLMYALQCLTIPMHPTVKLFFNLIWKKNFP